MNDELFTAVLNHTKPKGLKRFVLAVLSACADVNGNVRYDPAAEIELASKCAMRADRFERIVRELDIEGHLELDSTAIVIAAKGQDDRQGGSPSGKQQTSLLPGASQDRGSAEGVTRPAIESSVGQVWAVYVEVMEPRNKEAGEEERRVIRAALKVATPVECGACIRACAASDYHMKRGEFANRSGGKYNKLTQILKGRQGKETTRERIDWWLDRVEDGTDVGSSLTSVPPGILAARKDEVRRGHLLKGDPEAVEKAKVAEAWLKEQGIETVRREDGYPLWPSGGNA